MNIELYSTAFLVTQPLSYLCMTDDPTPELPVRDLCVSSLRVAPVYCPVSRRRTRPIPLEASTLIPCVAARQYSPQSRQESSTPKMTYLQEASKSLTKGGYGYSIHFIADKLHLHPYKSSKNSSYLEWVYKNCTYKKLL